jgi:small subunit ribosomal protein S17e
LAFKIGGKYQSLGNVRPERVKTIARELMSRFPDRFTADFEENKKIVKDLIRTPSSKLRNLIAGYITHLVSVAQTIESGEAEGPETEAEETEEMP